MLDLQKASLSKRISALLLDVILMFIAVVGFGCIFSEVVGYDAAFAEYETLSTSIIEKYGLNEEKVNKFNELANNFYPDFLNYDQETGEYYLVEDANIGNLNAEGLKAYDELKDLVDPVNAANKEMQGNEELNNLYEKVIVLSISNISISIFLGFLLLEFIVPLFLKNGQTLGKKVFGVAVIKTNGVKITTFQLFVRSILVKYTLETMIPMLMFFMIMYNVIGIVGTVVILGLVISEVIIYFKSGNNSLIHDIMAVTVCVDKESQMIFDTEEDLIAYKEKKAAEGVGKGLYGAESEVNVYSESEKSAFVPAPVNNANIEKDADFGNESQSYSTVTFGNVTLSDVTIDNISDEEFFVSDNEAETEVNEEADPKNAEEATEEIVETDELQVETNDEAIEPTEETNEEAEA